MKDILIINLTRMGDLLQTTPLMAGLKNKYPGLRITLLANAAFAEICRGIPLIDDLIFFDMTEYRSRLLNREHRLIDNYRFLEKMIDHINEKEYDLAMNVTHSPASAVLTSLVRAGEVRGFTMDSEGHRIIKHPWMRYFFHVVHNRQYNPFHIVDMYMKFGEVAPQTRTLIYKIPAEDEEKALTLLKSKVSDTLLKRVGIHLGASKNDKAWPVRSYASLADRIMSDCNAEIILFGSTAECALAEEFTQYLNKPPCNLVGKTGLSELSALLKHCDLFITNDTGPLHIATTAGTQVLDISTANVHCFETGPYGEDHYVIQADLPCAPCGFDVECNDRVCKSIVTPESVFQVAKALLEGNMNEQKFTATEWKDLQVYRSYFKDDGHLDFRPLIQQVLKKETLFRILYRQVWNMTSEDSDYNFAYAFERIFSEISLNHNLDEVHTLLPALKIDAGILEHLVTLAGEGHEVVYGIHAEASQVSPDYSLITETWKSINKIDRDIELIGHTNPSLKPLVLIFQFAREALEGNDLLSLSEKSAGNYRELVMRASALLELVNKFITNNEPEKDLHETDNLAHAVQHI
jgi:ADP-heptose:LPS heptosyltransferase